MPYEPVQHYWLATVFRFGCYPGPIQLPVTARVRPGGNLEKPAHHPSRRIMRLMRAPAPTVPTAAKTSSGPEPSHALFDSRLATVRRASLALRWWSLVRAYPGRQPSRPPPF
jgi:hypothetical protein